MYRSVIHARFFFLTALGSLPNRNITRPTGPSYFPPCSTATKPSNTWRSMSMGAIIGTMQPWSLNKMPATPRSRCWCFRGMIPCLSSSSGTGGPPGQTGVEWYEQIAMREFCTPEPTCSVWQVLSHPAQAVCLGSLPLTVCWGSAWPGLSLRRTFCSLRYGDCRGRPVMAGAGPSVSGTLCSSRCIWFCSLTVMTWRDRHRDVKSGVGPGELGRHCTLGFHPSKTWFVFRHRCFDPHDHGVHPLFVITCMFSMQRIFIFPKLASPRLPESPCRLVLHLLVNSLRSWRMTSGSIVWWWTISWTWSWKAWVTSVTTLLRCPSWRRPSFIDEVCQLASAWSRPLRHGVTSFPGTVSASQSLPTSCRLTLLAVFELWELRRFASRPSSYGSPHEHWHTDGCGSLSQSCPFLGPFFGLG